ncbi:hypothetical protein [Bacillus sp. 7894-2]|uniref:hypothetical protein n=1 Tax=Bacillus sp. 7894-2 TaxID=2021695 RepID=UPI000BA5859B|nr:hypothetical protein [Bacillus sp. 7894-2]PAE24043.1 hypothetical protein CHI10_14660 [Bacillus sp. 7894-2]
MTVVLEVWGDGDYGAMFVEDEYGVKKAYEEAKAAGGYLEIKEEDDPDWAAAYVKIHEFGPVDPEFIGFIVNEFMDYDRMKAHDFHVMEASE